ncbi:RCC1 domain-containing protein [Bifidobacterium sp. 7101]|uniref:RCC1 domain-containing protein n=1 Tax=Bifidobacterium sp. 7101 TaxID=1394175 RepID=UPI0006937132|nr:InlB B-repeat-containing protein [Bifidobacterium sp. 7101]
MHDGALVSPPADNPKRDGYRFDGWSEHGRIMDFRTPVTRDITLKAKWIPVTDWALSPDHGPASIGTSITITPPSGDSPSFSTLEAHDGKLIGVTGDDRLFTWTSNDKKPIQVPSPRDTSGEVRFITGVVGDDRYAALSRDHRIYTWSKVGETPALLDTGSTTYTSIAIAADRLIAADRKGQVHIWTSKGEPTGKAISLPKQALAIKAAGNADRMLALDSKGQVWIWWQDTFDTGQIQPVKLANRIVQISAMDHGFMLLDSTGQTSYLDNRQTQPETLVLSDHSAITVISCDATQTVLVDIRGRLWAWHPGNKPTRADDGNQQYMQAVKAGNRITALNRNGGIYRWSLEEQGQPGQPARLDTTQAPTLESVSMDSQPLTLTRNNGSWQADIPPSKPGPAVILITGRQDGQPLTRSLTYTVDQTLTRDTEPRSTLTVHFDTGGGNPEPEDQSFPVTNGKVKRPSPDPSREGYLFDGWFIGEVAYDFSRPVSKDLTLTAKWTESRNTTWSISPDKGSQLGRESTTITPPDSTSRGIRFNQVSASTYDGSTSYGFSLAVGSDGNAYAWGNNEYGRLGDGSRATRTTPVKVEKPTDLPEDFTYVQVSAGGFHSLAVGSDGNAYAWGYNSDGQIGDGSRATRTTPVKVEKPTDAPADFTYAQVSAGRFYSLALGSDGNAWAWGRNSDGQIGDGTDTDRNTPVRVKTPDRNTYPDLPKDFTYMQVSAGNDHSLALGSDGYAWAWGCNQDGPLGNNTTSPYGDVNPVPKRVRDPANPTDTSKGLKAAQVSAGLHDSLAVGSDGNAYAWGYNSDGRLGDDTTNDKSAPVPVAFNLQLVITGVKFDSNAGTNLTRGDGSSVTVLTPAHLPGMVTVSVDYTLGGAPQTPDTSLRYTYLPAGVLPRAGGEGILLALATGMTGMGGVLASRRHRKGQRSLSHASHE